MSTPILLDAPTLAEAVGARVRPYPEYTGVELAIVRGLAAGRSERTIGRELDKTPVAVHAAISDLLAETGCRTRAHLVARLLREGKIT